jgi:hypothetical protein
MAGYLRGFVPCKGPGRVLESRLAGAALGLLGNDRAVTACSHLCTPW